MRLFILAALMISAGLAAPGLAMADPCEAVPAEGPAPAYLQAGSRFSGDVVYVIDGDSLCVATGPGPANLVEVRLGDFNAPETNEVQAPEAKAALERVAFGQPAECVAGAKNHDRIVAICKIDGHAIGDLMRDANIVEGGNGARRETGWIISAPPAKSAGSPSKPATRLSRLSCAGGPFLRGQPGYSPLLDGDNDGVACEPQRRQRR